MPRSRTPGTPRARAHCMRSAGAPLRFLRRVCLHAFVETLGKPVVLCGRCVRHLLLKPYCSCRPLRFILPHKRAHGSQGAPSPAPPSHNRQHIARQPPPDNPPTHRHPKTTPVHRRHQNRPLQKDSAHFQHSPSHPPVPSPGHRTATWSLRTKNALKSHACLGPHASATCEPIPRVHKCLSLRVRAGSA